MINIDDRIFKFHDLNEAEYWLLSHLTIRLGKDHKCFPSNTTLMKDTGWAKEKLQRVKKSLEDKGVIRIEKRFKGDRQTSNLYHIETDLIGVFVDARSLTEEGVEIREGSENRPPVNGPKIRRGEGYENPTTEVLIHSEVLKHEESNDSSQKGLFSEEGGDSQSRKKEKPTKEKNPVFTTCIHIWMKEIHPEWVSFSAVDGKSLKSLLDKMRKYSENKNGTPPSNELAINFFKHFCESLPPFYKSQPLTVLAAKFDPIVDEIKTGQGKKKGFNQMPSANRVFGKYGS